MDGRWSLWLAGGLLCGLMGCSHFTKRPQAPAPGEGPPLARKPAPADVVSSKAKVKPDTLVAWANATMSAALMPGRGSEDRDQKLELARHSLQKALEIDPKHLNAQLGLARLYAANGDKDRAVEAFRKAAAAHPDQAGIWQEAAIVQARFRDYPGAIDSVQQALKIDPENRAYRKTLGFMLARTGRFEEGYNSLATVMGEAEARYNVARMMIHLKQDDGGRVQLALALKADPNFEPARATLASLQGDPQATPDAVVPPTRIQPVRYDAPAPAPDPVAPPQPEAVTPAAVKPAPVSPGPEPAAAPQPEPAAVAPDRKPAGRPQMPAPVLANVWDKAPGTAMPAVAPNPSPYGASSPYGAVSPPRVKVRVLPNPSQEGR